MKMQRRCISTIIIIVLMVAGSASLICAQEQPKAHVGAEKVSENIYLFADEGGMGNTIVLTGDDGVLLVDTKAGEVVDSLLSKISELSRKPIRFAVNIHWHFDHVGGNEEVVKTGAAIIAHENVRKHMRMSHDMKIFNNKVPPSPESAQPLVTFSKDLTFHMNGEDVHVFHLEPGHTDGDAVIFFPKANLIHMGDLYFEGLYPYIGIYSGGTINDFSLFINHCKDLIDDVDHAVDGSS